MDVKPHRSRSVDGLPTRPSARQSAASTLVAPPQPQPLQPQPLQAPYRLDFTAPDGYQPKRHWWKNLLFPLAILMCLSASFVVQSLPLGIAAIAVYAIVGWIKSIPSRVSFIMAFLALLTVVVLLVVRQNVELASNFATYTFLLLVVGIVSAMLESRVKPKHPRSKIPHLRG